MREKRHESGFLEALLVQQADDELKNYFIIISLQFQTISMPYKMCVTKKRTYGNRGWNLENPYVLTVFSAVPSLLSHTGDKLAAIMVTY